MKIKIKMKIEDDDETDQRRALTHMRIKNEQIARSFSLILGALCP